MPWSRFNANDNLKLIDSQSYTSSTTYAVPSGAKFIVAECIGGGGGGQGGGSGYPPYFNGPSYGIGGTGGSGGQYFIGDIVVADLANQNSISITVGAGGTGGAGGNQSQGNGTDGGISSAEWITGLGGVTPSIYSSTVAANITQTNSKNLFGINSGGDSQVNYNGDGQRGFLGGGAGGAGATESITAKAGGSRVVSWTSAFSGIQRLFAGGPSTGGASATANSGAGGAGGAINGVGGSGASPGGGGGGGGANSSGTGGAGGVGGSGRVRIWVYG